MIVYEKDRPRKVIEELKGGKGKTKLTFFCENKDLPPKCKLAAMLTLENGCSLGPHAHDGETEFYYVLSGVGNTLENGEVVQIKAGDITITGGGNSHYIEGASEEPLKLLAIVLLDK